MGFSRKKLAPMLRISNIQEIALVQILDIQRLMWYLTFSIGQEWESGGKMHSLGFPEGYSIFSGLYILNTGDTIFFLKKPNVWFYFISARKLQFVAIFRLNTWTIEGIPHYEKLKNGGSTKINPCKIKLHRVSLFEISSNKVFAARSLFPFLYHLLLSLTWDTEASL